MTPRGRRLLAVVVVLVLVGGAYAGWRVWQGRGATVPPDASLTEQCREVPSSAQRITLTASDGEILGGALVGSEDATVGLVLRHGASQTICDWLPWAGSVADSAGVRVLLFDRRGFGSSPGTPSLSAEPGDTVLAVDRLRQEGVDRVLTMASSMGNSVMFSALPDLPEKPCGVISVSPVLRSGDAGGSVDGSRIAGLPDNLWVTWESGNPSIVANAQRVLDAAGPGAHAHAVDTTDHSIVLVDNHADVRDFLAEAAASCGSGS
ncbi:MAG: alpha/beta hydrolase [Nocardioidaceae bacterium]